MIVQKLDKPVSAWLTTLIQSYSTPCTQQPETLTETHISTNLLAISSFAISLFVFLLTKNNTTLSPGFLGQRSYNLQRAGTFDVILTSLIQYSKTFDVFGSIRQSSFQIWSTAAGYGELCAWFQPIRNGKIF